MITDTQREARNKGIGSSDVPALFGIDPWKTQRDVWLVKTGAIPGTAAGEAARIGSALEPVILSLASEELGRKIVAPTSTFVRGVLRANVDGMIDEFKRGQPIVEAKMVSQDDEWGDPGSDQVPDRVRLQVTHQMLAAGSRECWIARLLCKFGVKFSMYHVLLDDDLAASVEQRCEEWWQRHVVAGEEPTGAISPDVAKQIIRTTGKTIIVPEALAAREREAKIAMENAEAAYEEAKYAVIGEFGDAEIGECPALGVRYKFSEVKSRRVDTKALEAAHPDIVAAFRNESSTRRWSAGKMKA
jgi:putative phage-type endonuclease